LVVGDRLAESRVAAAARDDEHAARHRDLDLFGPDAREIDFDEPALARAVHVGRRSPGGPRHPLAVPARQLPQVSVD
jgi:hypothetical protein